MIFLDICIFICKVYNGFFIENTIW